MRMTERKNCGRWLQYTVIAAVSSAGACGSDEPAAHSGDAGSSVTCGEGTVRQADRCVIDSQHAPDSGMTMALTCGDGTKEVDGVCVPDPTQPRACGQGTTNADGTCVVTPVQLAISGLQVTHLALTTEGHVLDGSAGADTMKEFYPIGLSVGVTYSGDPAVIPVAVGLRPADAQDTGKPESCFLTGLAVEHPGGQMPTEAVGSIQLDVPRGCLADGQGSRKLVPVVYVDPDQTLNAAKPGEVSLTVAFAGPNKDDGANAHCHRSQEMGAATGDCGVALNLVRSPGLDFELESVAADSSVLVLDKCGDMAPDKLDLDAWKAIVAAPDSLANDRPATYRCNSRIIPDFKVKQKQGPQGLVPDLDAQGNTQLDLTADGDPQIATVQINGVTYPSFLYGEPDLVLASKVITHGETSSDVGSVEKASAFPDDRAPIAHNALVDHGLQIRYRLRPATSDSEDDWQPIYVHSKGEQAKADAPTMSGQEREQVEDTEAVPATPTYYSHGLYLENDCGEKNGDTCNAMLTSRDDVIYGKWANETNFTVQACLVPVNDDGDDALALDTNPDNNCKDVEIRIVRRPTSGNTQDAHTSYNFRNTWDRSSGDSDTIRSHFHVHTYNTLDTDGASSENVGLVELNSDLVGDREILRATCEVSADIGGKSRIETSYIAFDQTVDSYFKEQSRLHAELDWGIHKEKKKNKDFHVAGFKLDAEAKVYGTVGVRLDLDLTSVNASSANSDEKQLLNKFPDAQKLGWLQVTVNPNGHVKASASVDFDAVLLKAGIKGSFDVFELDAPIKANLKYLVTSLSPLEVQAWVWATQDLEIQALDGKLYLYAERLKPFDGWDKFWDKTLVSFKGWDLDQRLWSSPKEQFTIRR